MTKKTGKTEFPVLYHKTAKGSINIWSVWAEGSKIYTRWGQQDGKIQTSCKEVVQKNVGRANETSVEEQAVLEAQSMWTFKKERKYSETLEATEETIFLPMLAKDFEKRKRLLGEEHYPVFGQPKFDGCRTMASWVGTGKNKRIKLTSRGGKEYILPHLCTELEGTSLPEGDVLDGELYVHGMGLQEINHLVRGTKNIDTGSVEIEYHVYDYVAKNLEHGGSWLVRRTNLEHFFKSNRGRLNKVKQVHGKKLASEREVYAWHDECVENGYEGAIVRLESGVYKFGYRSADLLKVKAFKDEEFEITGFTNGIGKFSECIIFECKTESGGSFTVVPKGTFEQRAEWLKNGKSFIGQYLKVQFFDYTEDKLPQFPVGLAVRLEEDM